MIPSLNPTSETANPSTLSKTLVLFGALGDLSLRKLYPSLFQLHVAGMLDVNTRIMGIARKPHSLDEYASQVSTSINTHCENASAEDITTFCQRLAYQQVDMTTPDDYLVLAQALADWDSHITYYLATPPGIFDDICRNLHHANLAHTHTRVVLEKPIGNDLASSQEINRIVGKYFSERQVYRIDHYLGKETVQNLLALRFANPMFSHLWNHQYIDYVEITVAEEVGIEGRWGYFDAAGQMRDMVQNHLLQLLCLVAMEPPARLDADCIRDEKVRILDALKSINPSMTNRYITRGQYSDGHYASQSAPGYLNEPDAVSQSNTETYIALRVDIANWRWANTPFYLRTGKRLNSKNTEIVVHFRSNPHFIFSPDQEPISSNKLVISLQPSEGISLQTITKEPGINNGMRLRKDLLHLDFAQNQAQQNHRIPDAYERLLLEALKGNQSLFVRSDEVEAAWRWCDQVRRTWESSSSPLHTYPAGSFGPHAAYEMIATYGHLWYEHC